MRTLLKVFCLFAVAAITQTVPSAKADSFNVDFSGVGLTETAIVTTTTTLNGSGAYTILSVAGEINGISLTGLSSFAGADEFLYPSQPYVDFSGVSFPLQTASTIRLDLLAASFTKQTASPILVGRLSQMSP